MLWKVILYQSEQVFSKQNINGRHIAGPGLSVLWTSLCLHRNVRGLDKKPLIVLVLGSSFESSHYAWNAADWTVHLPKLLKANLSTSLVKLELTKHVVFSLHT